MFFRPSSGDGIQPITTRHRVQPLLHVCRRGELNQINFNSHGVTQLGCGGGICGSRRPAGDEGRDTPLVAGFSRWLRRILAGDGPRLSLSLLLPAAIISHRHR